MLLSHCQFRRLLWGALLGIFLVIGQVSWAAPKSVSPEVLATQIESEQAPLIVDVRSPEEFAAGHIPGAINLPYREVPFRLHELADFEHSEIILYCEVGGRASIAGAALEQTGFDHISMLAGHLEAWHQVGLPIDTAVSLPTR